MDRRARRCVQRAGPTTKCSSISEERLACWARRPVVEAVANHHNPTRVDAGDFGILAATRIANGLIHGEESSDTTGSTLDTAVIDLEYCDSIGVCEKLPEWQDLARQVIDGSANKRGRG